MPPPAPLSKISGCRALGATVVEGDATVDACVAQARELRARAG